MSKAILILEMPSCCNNCPCFDGMEYGCCNYLKKDIEDILIIDKDCPLKPMPKNKEFEWTDSFGIHNFKKGFNACIDEILGEEE